MVTTSSSTKIGKSTTKRVVKESEKMKSSGRALFVVGFLVLCVVSDLMMHVETHMNKRQTYIVQVRNDMKPTVFSTVNQWYRSTLAALESSTPDDADQDQPPMLHVYTKVFHGFSARLTKAQAEEMKARPEVLNVYPDQIHQLHTTRSPQFLGILNPQDQNKNKNHIGLLRASDYGSNVIIGVLDTGIWPERESFHDRGLGPVPPLIGPAIVTKVFRLDIILWTRHAVRDGVDIISLSLGSPPLGPFQYNFDSIAIATFGAIDHGVFVSASAGNSGPKDFMIANVAPWITIVSALVR
ncbi:hypothetical protein Scep_030747 [Stephania cephalantha]|uniref:Inhibitor I9 domain-containing protein n=1 Tax=Stephania cephalantha TaxID=152367 RepID=A0AAP0E0D0_9MAGN